MSMSMHKDREISSVIERDRIRVVVVRYQQSIAQVSLSEGIKTNYKGTYNVMAAKQ